MNALLLYLQNNGTKVLGLAVGTLTVLVSSDVIPTSHIKFYLAAISVLTYWRGQANSNAAVTTQAASVIIAQHAALTEAPLGSMPNAVESKSAPLFSPKEPK